LIFLNKRYRKMNKFIGVLGFSLLAFQNIQTQVVAVDTSLNITSTRVIDSIKMKESPRIVLNWIPTYEEALNKAKEEKKPVLIYFTGSDWCGLCKTLDNELFHTERFKVLSDTSLILLEVDIPRRKNILDADKMSENLYLKDKYKVKAFPTLMMVNHKGKKIAEKRGYVITEYYYPFFESVISQY